MYTYKKGKNKKTLLNRRNISIFVVVLLLLGVGTYFFFTQSNNNEVTEETATTQEEETIDFSPPSEEEQAAIDDNKQKILAEEERRNSGSSTEQNSKRKVNPVITSMPQDGGTVSGYGFISGVIENGGTCTFTFTRGSEQVSESSNGVADATTTRCPPVQVSKNSLSAGSWDVVLNYSSGAAEGTSDVWSLQVN